MTYPGSAIAFIVCGKRLACSRSRGQGDLCHLQSRKIHRSKTAFSANYYSVFLIPFCKIYRILDFSWDKF